MKNGLLVMFTMSILMSIPIVAENMSEEEKHFKVEDPNGISQPYSLHEDKKNYDDRDFFMAWLTGENYPYCSGTWMNHRGQLKDIPAFVEALKRTKDSDVIKVKTKIGPKSDFYGQCYMAENDARKDVGKRENRYVSSDESIPFSVTPNLQCSCYGYENLKFTPYYICELTISAEKARELAKTFTVESYQLEDRECKGKLPRALSEYAEKANSRTE